MNDDHRTRPASSISRPVAQAATAARTGFRQLMEAVTTAIEDAAPAVRRVSDATVATVKSAPILSALAVAAAGFAIAWSISRGNAIR